MPDIFVSYSREDLARAQHFARGFEREGFTVWWDQALDTGEAFDRVTEKALEEAGAVVVLWSKHSVESRWVRAEATQADDNRKLVPVTIEPCKRPIMFQLTQTADLTHWIGDPADRSWQTLVAGLRRQLGRSTPATAPASTVANPSRKNRSIAIGIAVLLIAGVVAFMLGRGTDRPAAQPEIASATQTAPVTLAVLPFDNLSSDPEQDYFSDGLTEEILNHLAQINGLVVTGRTSSFSFKGKNEDLRVIAGKLGVANLLEGSIRKDGNQLRITAQLIDGKTGGHIWSQTYDREKSGVFAMQEDIARDVAKALSVKLYVGDIAGVPGMTRNVEAYDEYLAAATLTNTLTPESVREAIAHLQRAITLDPGFAFARVQLSNVYGGPARVILTDNSPQAWRAKAEAEIEAARRLVPDAFYVQVTLAQQNLTRGGWIDAARLYQRAASSGKLQTMSTAWQSGLMSDESGLPIFFLFQVGRLKEAHALAEQMKALDPLNVWPSIYLAETFATTGDYAAALSEWDRGLHLEGAQVLVRYGGIMTALATRDRSLIDPWLESVISLPGGTTSDLNATMKRLLDQPSQARLELRRHAQGAQGEGDWRVIVFWMAYFGDPEGALEILRRESGHADSAGEVSLMVWRPILRDVRKLPGFKDLARDMGLVDYWREYEWADLCKPVGTDDFECT